MKSSVLDIETTGFDAIGSGSLLCAVFKPIGGREIIYRADKMNCRPGNEKRLIIAVYDEIAKWDLIIGHNVERFDLPWLRSRGVFFGLPEMAHPFVYDTLRAFKRLNYKTVLNGYGQPCGKLGHVVDFFGLEQEKSGVYPREWWSAVWREADERKRAMDKIVSHCYADVRMTEKVYHLLLPVDRAASIRRLR